MKITGYLFFVLLLPVLFYSSGLAQDNSIMTRQIDGLTLVVSLDDVPAERTIWLNYKITNSSDQVVSFPYRYYEDYPVGMSGIVTKKSGKSLVRFGSRHILDDEIMSTDLENDRVDLQPGASLEGTVNVLDMIILKNHYGETFVNPGKYKVGLSFFGNDSNLLEVQIPRQ